AFTAQSGWNVSIDVVPWGDYWTRLPLDIASGDAADVYWVNSANYIQLKDSDALLDINEIVPDGASQWEKSVVDLYTRDGGLWGVPQIWDSIALFYNKALVEEAGVDPSALAFDPAAESDSLREAGAALTVDGNGAHPGEDGFDADSRKQFGFNSQADRQASSGPMIACRSACELKPNCRRSSARCSPRTAHSGSRTTSTCSPPPRGSRRSSTWRIWSTSSTSPPAPPTPTRTATSPVTCSRRASWACSSPGRTTCCRSPRAWPIPSSGRWPRRSPARRGRSRWST